MSVLVTYDYPVSGTNFPTLAQMNPQGGGANVVTGTAYFGADADTVALITHNMNLSTVAGVPQTANAPNTTQGFPLISFYVQNQGGTGTVIPVLSATITGTLAVITKTNLANTSCTVFFSIFRPNTLTI